MCWILPSALSHLKRLQCSRPLSPPEPSVGQSVSQSVTSTVVGWWLCCVLSAVMIFSTPFISIHRTQITIPYSIHCRFSLFFCRSAAFLLKHAAISLQEKLLFSSGGSSHIRDVYRALQRCARDKDPIVEYNGLLGVAAVDGLLLDQLTPSQRDIPEFYRPKIEIIDK